MRPWLHFLVFLGMVLMIGLSPDELRAQDTPVQSGRSLTVVPSDSAALTDTLTPPKQSDIEGPVKYRAEKITFSMDKRRTFLEGNVRIEYQNMKLEAGRVMIDWKKNVMVATGVADSTDSLGNPVYSGLPVFSERGSEPIHGFRLEYDFKHQRGKVLEGRTNMEPGYYRGELIKKVGKKTLLVKEGYFTSCDSIEHPHYYFKADKMRIIVNKRAVAKPIYMYIADIPVFAIPFGVFPMEKGRRSGFIIPKFGTSSYGGRYLRDFGYYWAASQYWDATLLSTFYERTGTVYSGEFRYKKRYNFSGNVLVHYAPRDVTTGQKKQRWSIRFNHNQKIGETMTLNGSGQFVSDRTFMKNYSNNLENRLDQIISTNVNFSKRWPNSKNSLNVSIRRNENLQTGNLDYTLPRISFSHTQSNLIPFNPAKSHKKRWYHNITYNFTSDFQADGSKHLQPDSSFLKKQRMGWQHRGGLSLNFNLLKYFRYRQSVSFQELWVPEYYQYTWVDSLNSAIADTVRKPRARHTVNTQLGLTTTLYGLFEIPFSPLKLIRHKIDPTIRFTFTPDYTDPRFDYVQTFVDSTGHRRYYDRFTGNPFGGTPTGESRMMSISLGNLFQGKWIHNGQEKKIDLFHYDLSTAYNFLADSLKWRDISSSLRTRATRNFNFSMTVTHSLYKVGHQGYGRRNEYVWENGFSLPRLVNLRFSTDIHLAPPARKEEEKKAPSTADTTETPLSTYAESLVGNRDMEALRNLKFPWDVTVNLVYNVNRRNIHQIQKDFTASVNARLEITRNWRIQYSASFDLINKEIAHQSFNIYRDLHCWEMSFNWQPNPVYSSFTFEIHIKEPMLRDIKLTKSSGGYLPF